MAKAKHWHNQEWQVIDFNGKLTIVGPDHKCLETTLDRKWAEQICSFTNRVYKLGLKRGRQSVFRERRPKKPNPNDPGGYIGEALSSIGDQKRAAKKKPKGAKR